MIELGERLGAGKEAEVFAYGGNVAKLYREGTGEEVVRREAGNIAVAVARGLPVPAVHEVRAFGSRWGLVMDRAPGPAFAVALTAGAAPEHFRVMVQLHRAMHAQPGTGLLDLRSRLRNRIKRAAVLGTVRQVRVLEALDALPDGDRICHGDFHPFNIMGAPDAALVIDWLDATSGAPAADVCRSYVILVPHLPALASAYLDAYVRAAGVGREDIVQWMPVVAGARVVENVPDELDGLIAMTDGL